ncbi:VanY-A/VanY-F/VanY-M family D-Ala-D-Ala carboxypeptidase [Bacillus tuaregi]|uniref:VanY-A/VanY-F/VanY-M family D-Ala-D-Ala carboxypeptidase n=1 Tax=Bacillus tuaregi TaxID=1816695 RepID=UPI0008F816C4|nr:VanY-A/VanY-F/VanY-M family D-Ala-D-Ala carboxypeptidase [Bacillus tuaregi]
MKKWGFLLIILSFGLTFLYTEPFFEPKIEIHDDTENKIDRGTSENIEIEKDQIYQGNLLLVNQDHPVHQESILSDIVNLYEHQELTKGYGLMENEMYLSEEIAREFSKMILAANNEGVQNFCITSGFRGFEAQSVLYQEMGSDYALPAGYSEHNLGLALDVGSTQMKMADAPEGKWIEENAWKYGFILRYPKDKTDITGIQYEPWHIRYVGLPHSAIMQEKNFVLEEYLEYLKEKKQISANLNGESYKITYFPVSENALIEVPMNHVYEISGNNTDGVIVTVHS